MTFADKTIVPGRQAANILELDLDGCARSYGTSPCTATLALQNGLLRSQEFDNAAWTKVLTTVTANTDNDPLFGNAVVDSLFETTGNGIHYIRQDYAGVDVTKTWTLSFIVNGIDRPGVALVIFNTSSVANWIRAQYNFTDATVLNALAFSGGDAVYEKATIKAVGSGFFRVTLTGVPDALGGATDGLRCELRILNDSYSEGSYTGDVTKGVRLFAGQVREGSFPGIYALTTTAVVNGMGSVDDACFNTFGTCQDTPNYLKEVRTLRFCDAERVRPPDLIAAFPSITGVRYGATRINPGGKFSVRGTVSVQLQDFAHNDAQVDDYLGERSFDPETQGTFFGKLKERSKFYVGRPMRVLEGYLDEPFSLSNFRTREYIIENISGPTADGKVTITGKDILAKARDDRAKAPTASTYTLRAAMTSGQTTLLPQTGEAVTMIAGDKHVRVNDEIIELVSESPTDTLNVVRARGGTTAAAHAIDDSIQECLTYEDEPVIDVIDDLLTNFANIPASYIPTTDWETEEGASLTGYNMETIISAPTGVTKLLQEICAITLIDLWYSDVDQEVKLKLQTPFTDVTETWTDDNNFLMDSVKVKDLNDQRLSRVLIYYGMRNFAEKLTEPENYNFVHFEIEADKEGVNKYDDEKIRTIFSRWFDGTNTVQVELTSQRLLDRFGITPIEIMFEVDAKDVETLQTGDVYDAQTRMIQDINGTKKTTRFQVVETKPKDVGSKYLYKSLAFFQDPTPDSLTISTNQTDYDIFVELGGPPGPVDVTVTINAAINVDGTTGNPAMTTAGMHPDSTIDITNNGNIRGHGGAGGNGRDVSIDSEFETECLEFNFRTGGTNGADGGDAIYATVDLTIDNTNGNIWAGAGGGGGGGSDDFENDGAGGGGGGGGIGTDTAAAGAGGIATGTPFGCFGAANLGNGVAGTAGSTSAAGAGGALTWITA